ncbi:MAG: metal-sulfur cluster assembly factor [Deltaproteobacteria bacterium]|nr:metal-sulfur cluster assembly factor [Deltaproteobacteria bacterium]
MTPTKHIVEQALRLVIDPEVGINIFDLGLVYAIDFSDARVDVRMTMTTRACPLGSLLTANAEAAIRAALPNLEQVDVALVWEPPWTPQRMSDAARQQLTAGTTRKQPRRVVDQRPPAKGVHGPLWRRLPLLLMAGIGLITGLVAGLLRLGFAIPIGSPLVAADHGALMVAGFLGTLIGLERAVALSRLWGFIAPILTGVGTLLLLAGAPAEFAKPVVTIGSWLLTAVSLQIIWQQRALFTATMAAGALALAVGCTLWTLNWPIFRLVWWWVAFLLLTIAGERLELSRLKPRAKWALPAFTAALTVFMLGVATSGIWPHLANYIIGGGILGIAAWLGANDIARQTIRRAGLTRYVAVCLLSGYLWLACCAAWLLYAGPQVAGSGYDGSLHAFFVGFVFSMIFGHAPIILPAVLRVGVRFTRVFYLPLALLHLSLLIRLLGDFGGSAAMRRWGGMGNALAIVAFLLSVVISAIRATRTTAQSAHNHPESQTNR